MRLLNTSTYELHEFPSLPVSGYAILSHRWEDEELTFNNLQDREYMINVGKTSKGWRKIQKFCDIARSRGLHWGWVDTCCIDKSSSAELSEAINSMYGWYRNARECIVYMNDVHSSASAAEETFKLSKWFTRGWTLQELLAPPSLLFFNSGWEFLNTRKALCSQISMVTGIPVPFLYDPLKYSLQMAGIAQRMSWASLRETTRAEDQAYCLLGLFGVNMPPLYGEGGTAAFARLQLEIARTSDDESLFAWRENESDPFQGGMLAKDLRSFADSGNVLITSEDKRPLRPYSFTNKGLSIQMALYKGERNKLVILSFGKTQGLEKELDLAWQRGLIFVAPISCIMNGYSLAVLLMAHPFQPNKSYARVGLALLRDEFFGGDVRDIFIGPAQLFSRALGDIPLKELRSLAIALRQDLVRQFWVNEENHYGLGVYDFHLKFSNDTGPSILFEIMDSTRTKVVVSDDFFEAVGRLGLPPQRVHFYRSQVPNITH